MAGEAELNGRISFCRSRQYAPEGRGKAHGDNTDNRSTRRDGG
jgi:hypothetical protein